METISQIYQRTGLKSILGFYNSDARHHQIAYQAFFILYGIAMMGWGREIVIYGVLITTCLVVQAIGIALTTKNFTGLKSALISSLSLCLMFKANLIQTYILVAVLSIAGKYLIRYKGKHVFNPTNFGICIAILITGDAWLSPGLWGSGTLIFFLFTLLGLLVLNKVDRIDSALSFLAIFSGLHFIRMVLYLGWEFEVFVHHLSSGTLLLFTFFMMTDPVTTPKSRKARIIWSGLIGLVAFISSSVFYIHTAPIWALFFLTPFVPLFNKYFKGASFSWSGVQSK